MICPNCHQVVKPGAAFCGNCGFQLATAQAPVAPQPAPQQVPAVEQQLTPVVPAHMHPAPFTQPIAVFGQSNNSAALATPTHNNGKAIAAFVCGVLGLVGWIIPLLGVVLGLLALIFGTIAIRSQKRVFAIIGIVLAVPVLALSIFFWVRAAQSIVMNRSNPLSGITTPSGSGTTQDISTPCYTTKIPASLKVTVASGSCTFQAVSQATGETYTVKVLQAPDVTPTNLSDAAQADSKNVISSTPGGSISGQEPATFSGSPAYEVSLASTDGSAGTIDYIYRLTASGNLVIVIHTQRTGKKYDVSDIESAWDWK